MRYNINTNNRNWIHVLNDFMDFTNWNEFIETYKLEWIHASHEFIID